MTALPFLQRGTLSSSINGFGFSGSPLGVHLPNQFRDLRTSGRSKVFVQSTTMSPHMESSTATGSSELSRSRDQSRSIPPKLLFISDSVSPQLLSTPSSDLPDSPDQLNLVF